MLGTPHSEQERLGVACFVVPNGQDHAGFGDPIIGWVFTDGGVHQHVEDLLDPGLPSAPQCDAVLVGVTFMRCGSRRSPKRGELLLQPLVCLPGDPNRLCACHFDVSFPVCEVVFATYTAVAVVSRRTSWPAQP